MNPTVWPQYGSISVHVGRRRRASTTPSPIPSGRRSRSTSGTSVAGREFVNSLFNGKVLSKTPSTSDGFKYVTYKVRLSPKTERGMYDMTNETPTRTASTGFVLPSNDEWVKAAYYDPKGGGTDSYWVYPTGPFDQPNISVLDPATGDVTNADKQPLATYNPNDPNSSVDTPGAPAGDGPDLVSVTGRTDLRRRFPADFPPGLDLPSLYMGNVSTVGQAKTPSPGVRTTWAATSSSTPTRSRRSRRATTSSRDWRYYHGGVANAPAYQVAIYGVRLLPRGPADRTDLSLDGLPRRRHRRPQVGRALVLARRAADDHDSPIVTPGRYIRASDRTHGVEAHEETRA